MKVRNLLTSVAMTCALFLNVAHAAHAMTLTSSEQQTLATVAQIDKNEIVLATLVLNKHCPASVVSLAKMMINQHGANLNQIMEMAGQAHVSALSSDKADAFAVDLNHALLSLGALNGKAFDKAYVDAMVSGHEGALKLIHDQLMETATTPEMKAFMTATQKAVQMHLVHAEAAQKSLS